MDLFSFPIDQLTAAAAQVMELSHWAATIADGVRAKAPVIAGAFDHAVWRGPAAEAAMARAGDQAASVSRAAAQLDQFAADLARHGRAAADRAEALRMAMVAVNNGLIEAGSDTLRAGYEFDAGQAELLYGDPGGQRESVQEVVRSGYQFDAGQAELLYGHPASEPDLMPESAVMPGADRPEGLYPDPQARAEMLDRLRSSPELTGPQGGPLRGASGS